MHSNILVNAENYTDSWGKELWRFLTFLCTIGVTEYFHSQHAQEKMATFIPILKDLVDIPIQEGNERVLELTTFAGTIRLVEDIDEFGKSYLTGALDGIAFDTGEFNTIDSLKEIIVANLNKNNAITDLHPGYLKRIAEVYSKTNNPIQQLEEINPELPDRKIQTLDQVATRMQASFRTIRQTRVAEPGSEVPALRYPATKDNVDGEVIAHKLWPDNGPHFPYVAVPTEPVSSIEVSTFKKLTHVSPKSEKQDEYPKPRYALLEFLDPSCAAAYSSNAEIIRTLNLKQFKTQLKINETQLMAEYLGEQNLFQQIKNRLYVFDYRHWTLLAEDIDRLHASNHAHRDIKLNNIFFVDGHMQLIDHDSLGKVGEFEFVAGTPAYWAPIFMTHRDDNADRNTPGNAFSKDQYTFFVSMIAAFSRKAPHNGQYKNEDIVSFTDHLPCSQEIKNDLISFLLRPYRCLSYPLSEYFIDVPIQKLDI